MRVFFISLFFLILLVCPALCFTDDAERYDNSGPYEIYTEYRLETTGIGTGSVTLSEVSDPTLSGNTVLLVHCIETSRGTEMTGTAKCAATTTIAQDPAYFSFVVQRLSEDYYASVFGDSSLYIPVWDADTGTLLCEFTVSHTLISDNTKFEVIHDGSYYDLYQNGIEIQSKVTTYTGFSSVIFGVGGVVSGQRYNDADVWVYLDDITTNSIVGIKEEFNEAATNITATWSAQLMRSHSDSDYSISLYSLSNTDNAGLIKTWDLPADDNATTSEYGYMFLNRTELFGLNYGLYLLEMNRDDDVEAGTYFYYDNLANPIGFPDVVLMGTTTVSSDIRDSANNGGTISPNGYVYLFANTTPGCYPVNYTLVNTPYSFTAELSAVYGADKISSTPITFKSLTNSYTVTLDGASVTGSRATGELSITGNLSENETVTIGDDTFEFDTDDSYTAGNIPVKLSSNLSDDSTNLTSAINNNGTESISATRSYTPTTASEYNYAPITITNNPGISGYQASINLSYQTGMSSDFANIRFYNDSVEIPYWIQSYTASTNATVWIPINSSSNIECRWGISGETESESNIKAVMVFGDDFTEESLNSTLWTDTSLAGTRAFVNGLMRDSITASTNAQNTITAKTDTNDASVITGARMRTTNSTGSDCSARLGIKSSSTNVGAKITLAAVSSPASKSIKPLNEMVVWGNALASYTESNWYVLEARHDYSSNFYYRNGQSGAWTSWAINPAGTHLCLHTVTTSNTIVAEYDYVYQRKYAVTEPTLTLGTVSVASSGPHAEITVQADSDGSELNGIATTETCVNATWAGSTLSGGWGGEHVTGSTYEYTLTDWTNYTSHIFTFTPDLTKAGVYGYVKDLSTSQGIHGAIVTISNDTFSTTVQTDEQGYYYLTQGMKAGETYSLKAQKSGYTESTSYTATTKESASSRKDIYLESTTDGSGIYYQSHDVTFTVLEYWYSSAGLPGVSYEVYNGSTSVKNGTTGSKGTFTVTKMNAGTNYTFILTSNGTTYTEYLEPGLTEYNLVLNKEGIVHTYYNSWLNLTYAETSDNVTVLYASNKTVSAASLTVTASNGTVVYSEVYNTSSGSFLFPSTEGDYNLQFNIEASDGSTASQAWSISSPPEVTLFPDSYPTWLKNTLFVAIIIIFLLAFGKSKNDIACGSVAVLTSLGYYFEWLSCGFNFVVLVWIIALGAIYLHYKRTGAVG